jgi:hypothetical protein
MSQNWVDDPHSTELPGVISSDFVHYFEVVKIFGFLLLKFVINYVYYIYIYLRSKRDQVIGGWKSCIMRSFITCTVRQV